MTLITYFLVELRKNLDQSEQENQDTVQQKLQIYMLEYS